MGQYWTFINIDKRQKYNGGSKNFEVFVSTLPVDIIKLLAIPEVGCNNSQDHDFDQDYYERLSQFLHPDDLEPLSWTGDRIICIGDYVGDWPDNILAAEDGHALERPIFLYRKAVDPLQSKRSIAAEVLVRSPRYSGPGVLRNLTKKLFVRSEGIPTFDSKDKLALFKDSPVDSYPGLGQILMSRIGFSSDPSAAMAWRHADTLSEGEWAGDRFDVRSYNDVKDELESDGWVDVTEREAERFLDIWNAEFGEM